MPTLLSRSPRLLALTLGLLFPHGLSAQSFRYQPAPDDSLALADSLSSLQHELALLMKSLGYFDYAFTMRDPDGSSFSVCYNDYERNKDYHGMTFHSLRYDGSKFDPDEIELNSKATMERVLPGQPGYVMIYEYFKKEKRIDLHLEKMN